jgi:capsular polysaccharide biosynthesis protein
MESERPVVYQIDHRNHQIFMHWFMYIIGGFYNLSHLPKPVKFHVTITQQFQIETLPLLAPDYEYVENISGYKVIQHPGTPYPPPATGDPVEYFQFVRNQLVVKNNLERKEPPFRRLYFRRSNAHYFPHHQGRALRHIQEEDKLVDVLKTNGFECLFLEEYNLLEKIKLFQEAALVVSPNGGALTGCYFAHKDTKVVIITPPNPGETQYIDVCKALSVDYICYDHIQCFDKYGNVAIHFPMCSEYTMKILDYTHLLNFLNTIYPPKM